MSIPLLSITVSYPGSLLEPSYVDITFENNSIFGMGTVYDAWCANQNADIRLVPNGVNYTGTFQATAYSSYELGSTLAAAFPTINQGNLGEVNWLLNQDYNIPGTGYSFGDVQAAIWTLLSGSYVASWDIGPTNSANVAYLVSQANLHPNYVPDITDGNPADANIDVLLAITTTDASHTVQQPMIIQVQSAALGDYVWLDSNGDGVQGASETGIQGVTVNLWRDTNGDGNVESNEILKTTTTDATGHYEFYGLTPGLDYQVQVVAPTGDTFTTQYAQGADANNAVATDSNVNASGLSGVIVLQPGQNNATIDAGLVSPTGPGGGPGGGGSGLAVSSLSGTVYVDNQGTGSFATGDTLLPGVTLALLNPDGTPAHDANGILVATVTTDANGNYSFGNLLAGNYQIVETQPNGYGEGTDTVGSEGGNLGTTDVINAALGAGAAGVNNNFGETLGSLSGLVYVDANNSGSYVAGDALLSGVTLTLSGTDANGHAVSATTTTNGSGQYTFGNLLAGTYTVTETQPAGYGEGKDTLGTYTVGAGAVTNETGSAATQDQTQVNQVAGAAGVNNNFGETLGSLSGLVYVDANNSGSYVAGDALLSGVTLTLSGTDANGHAVSATTTTNGSGQYTFGNLLAGTYTVTETQPAGYGEGKDTLGTYTVGAGAVTNETGSAATQDQTQVNQVAGAAGVNNNFGETLGSLSGLVYVDANNSGSYVAGDALLSGVTLTLSGTDANGHAVSATTTTNGSGQYTFGNLLAGTYTVTETQAGYGEGKDTLGTYTVGAGAVTNETGSAATQDQTQVNQVAGAAGVNNNFGETLGSLSGLVYVDANNSGSYVAGDALLSGVTLTLSGTDANGHAVSATTTTNGSGQYTFGNLLAGTYTVTETQAGYGEGKDTLGTYTVGAGAVTNETGSAATQDQTQVNQVAGAAGVNNNFGETLGSLSGLVYVDANNSGSYVAGDALLSGVTLTLSGTDANGHAVSATTTTNGSGQYTFGNLLAGTYTVTETQPAGYGEGKDTLGTYTVGAGAVTNETGSAATQDQTQVNQVAGAAGVNNNFGETLGSLSGLVYVDANNSGSYVAGDALLSGVTLTLSGTDANGHAVSATTTTNGSGQYTFGNLLAGTYTVTETQPRLRRRQRHARHLHRGRGGGHE